MRAKQYKASNMTALISLLLLVLVTCAPALSLASDEDRVILVGGDHNYPPYEFIDDQGQPSGYNVELTRAIAEVMGMNVEFRFDDWSNVREALEQGKLDVVQGMVDSLERRNTFDFSPPHAIVHQSIFARRGEPKASSLSQLKNKKVVVQRGGIMHDYLVQNAVGAIIIPVETQPDALRQLSAGKHDYALVANLPGLYLGKELGLSNIVPVGRPFEAQQYGYGVLKGNEALLAQFSEGLAILINTGQKQQIYNKWLAPLQDQWGPWRQYSQIAAILAALLLLTLGGTVFWNRMLRQQVSKRTAELHIQQKQLIQADKMASLGVLVSGVAHEINNPTSLLLLNLPIIKDVWKDCEETLEHRYSEHGDFILGGLAYSQMRNEIPMLLTDMNDGALRIKRIVNDLKDFAKKENETTGGVFDLNEVAATAIRLLDNSIHKSTSSFSVSYAPNLPMTQGNGQRIEQVIINLLMNACQALVTQSDAIKLRTYYEASSMRVCLEVTDEGCGISSKDLTRLLDPFYTSRREQGGTGLGLSVSSSIVQAHDGELVFKSLLGKGTVATLKLPMAEAKNDE
jgi:polar amino acid transport system substrate-binding protein